MLLKNLLFAIKSQSNWKWVLISKPILNTIAERHFMEFFEGDESTNTGKARENDNKKRKAYWGLFLPYVDKDSLREVLLPK